MADQDISKRIFVKGFSRETTESELRSFFESYGVVRESKIVRDKHRVNKGYAFITFGSQEIADELRDNEGIDFKGRQLSIGKAIRIKSSRSYSRHYHHWQPPMHRQELMHDTGAHTLYYSGSVDGNVYYPVQQPQVVLLAPPSYSQQMSYPSQNLYQPHPHSSAQQLYSPTTMVGGSYMAAATLPMQWNDYTTFNRVRQISNTQETPQEMAVGNSQIVSLAISDGSYVAEGPSGELPTQVNFTMFFLFLLYQLT